MSSRSVKVVSAQNLLELMLENEKDIGGKGFELVQQVPGRGRKKDSGAAANAFGLLLGPIKFTVIELDSTAITEYAKRVTGGRFRDCQLVGLSPNLWHDSALKITSHMLLPGTNFLVIKWSDGHDPTIIQFGCVDVPAQMKAASFMTVRQSSDTKLSERGGGALG